MGKARDYSQAVAARLEWSKTYKNDTAGGVLYVELGQRCEGGNCCA